MNWTDVGKTVGSVAPALGGIIGGFLPIPGGALIGKAAGNLLASVLGVPPTPDAVGDRLAQMQSDERIAAIKATVDRARAEIDGYTRAEEAYWAAVHRSIIEANQTIRMEILPENRHWFFTGWRPFIGWVFGLVALCYGIMLVASAGRAAWMAPDPLKTLTDSWPIFAAYFGVLGLVVGVLVKSRGDEKQKSMETGVPVNPVVPKKEK